MMSGTDVVQFVLLFVLIIGMFMLWCGWNSKEGR